MRRSPAAPETAGGMIPVEPAVGDPLGSWVMLANVAWSQVSCSGENTGGVAMDAAVRSRSGKDSARSTSG